MDQAIRALCPLWSKTLISSSWAKKRYNHLLLLNTRFVHLSSDQDYSVLSELWEFVALWCDLHSKLLWTKHESLQGHCSGEGLCYMRKCERQILCDLRNMANGTLASNVSLDHLWVLQQFLSPTHLRIRCSLLHQPSHWLLHNLGFLLYSHWTDSERSSGQGTSAGCYGYSRTSEGAGWGWAILQQGKQTSLCGRRCRLYGSEIRPFGTLVWGALHSFPSILVKVHQWPAHVFFRN